MRTRIKLNSILCTAVSIAAVITVLLLMRQLSVLSVILACAAGLFIGVLLSLRAGKIAVDKQIDMLLDVRNSVRQLNKQGNLKYNEPADYELAHPVKFIYNELSHLNNSLNGQRDELSKHKRLFDNIKEGIIIADIDGKIITINKAAREIFEVNNNSDEQRLEHVILDHKLLSSVSAVTSGKESSQEITISTKKGTYNASVNKVDAGGSGAIILYIRDITAIAKAEKVRSDFVANVSHELKTPLTSICGFAELLDNDMVTNADTKKQYLTLIRLETDRLMGLINDILKLSELDSIAIDEGKTIINIAEIARNVVDLLEPLAQRKSVVLQLDIKDSYIEANPARISELFINLVDNAIKYNKENGSVTVKVQPERDEAVIKVIDTGIGIPEADQERIFERFYRVDKSRSKESGGTGLGLSIVKHIVELYKGQIKLKSTLNKGTEVSVRFQRLKGYAAKEVME